MTPSQISLVLSGGASNQDPNASLGGDPSSFPVSQTNTHHNLFGDGVANATSDSVQFRCVYYFNDHPSESLFGTRSYINYQSPEECLLGLLFSHEVQVFRPRGNPGLEITLRLENSTPLHWVITDDASLMASQLQGALADAAPAGGPVGVVYNPVDQSFEATYADYRHHRLVEVFSTQSGASCTVVRTQGGSPINTVAQSVAAGGSPTGVEFVNAIKNRPIIVGTLLPGEGFPLWVRRSVPAANPPLTNARFALRLVGDTSPVPQG